MLLRVIWRAPMAETISDFNNISPSASETRQRTKTDSSLTTFMLSEPQKRRQCVYVYPYIRQSGIKVAKKKWLKMRIIDTNICQKCA